MQIDSLECHLGLAVVFFLVSLGACESAQQAPRGSGGGSGEGGGVDAEAGGEGGGSAKAVEALRAAGYDKARNLTGGTLAWSDEVDPDLPKY